MPTARWSTEYSEEVKCSIGSRHYSLGSRKTPGCLKGKTMSPAVMNYVFQFKTRVQEPFSHSFGPSLETFSGTVKVETELSAQS